MRNKYYALALGVTFLGSLTLGAWETEDRTIRFAEGVTTEKGWYDVNKVGRGENGDINMCWAAAASNILQWWQDRYIEAGNTLPEGAVSGPGTTYELALMDVFYSQWNNMKGGHVPEAIPWYFEGVYYGKMHAEGSVAYPLEENSGGYFKDVWSDIYPHLYHDYSYMFDMYTQLYVSEWNNYALWGSGSGLWGKDRLKKFSELVVTAIDRGMASMTVALASNLGSLHHSVTLWGYEIDNNTGLLTRIWITDSDDLESEPKPQVLHEVAVSIGEGNSHVRFESSTLHYKVCYAVAVCPVSGYQEADDDKPTAIPTVRDSNGASNIYDLNGRRVASPRRGLYIVDGKKMWLKP